MAMHFKKKRKQAQRRAAGDCSERKYSKKYVFMSKNMTFGPLGHILTYGEKCDIWLVRAFFALFKISTPKNRNFHK